MAGSGAASVCPANRRSKSLLHRPEIFQVSEEETDSRPGVQLAFTAIARALKALETDRKREGKALRADFIRRINTITEAVPKIERLAEASRSEIVANFQTQVARPYR